MHELSVKLNCQTSYKKIALKIITLMIVFYYPDCAERIKEIVISSVSLIHSSELEYQIQL